MRLTASRIIVAPWQGGSMPRPADASVTHQRSRGGAALRYAPACALTALIAPEVLTQHGAWAITLANVKLIGAVVAVVTMLVTGNTLATMAIGMGAFFIARLFV